MQKPRVPELGWTIPEEQFIYTPKKRGRPKRNRKIICLNPTEDEGDLISRLVVQARKEQQQNKNKKH